MFLSINRVVKIMVVTDFFVNSAFGSFAPIFAIFITNQIAGGSVQIAGFATSVYWIIKSLIQLPIARFLDKTDGETDDFWAMFLGFFMSGLVPFMYMFITEPWHLYMAQAFLGVSMAIAVPAWYSIFTRHVDKWRISFEWSLESVFSVGFATAGASALGGYIAETFGFQTLFFCAGVLAVLGSFLLLFIQPSLIRKKGSPVRVLPERPHRRTAHHS
ncbi:MAG: MFS transporter [Patescibacteria group bacterium]